ncbi:MAG: thiamine pyrophosphate-binding protein [Vicinamibacterales bacterium]
MPTCAAVLADTLADAGTKRIFGLPGGEVLEVLEATRRAGIDFALAHDENAAAFMAGATGEMLGRPGVCLSTLGPGAMNMVLGVANAFLDRSPLLAITATLPRASAPFATHQNLELERIYASFTKGTFALDGRETAFKVRSAIRLALSRRPGPVHIAIPGDVAGRPDVCTVDPLCVSLEPEPVGPADVEAVVGLGRAIHDAKRPVVILGLDLSPYRDSEPIRRFVESLGVPVFVAPKAKGVLDEDHPLFFGVCAGVAADHVILDFFDRADLLVGIGYDPVESNRIWHKTLRLVSAGPTSIAAGSYAPEIEAVGDVRSSLESLAGMGPWKFHWTGEELADFRRAFEAALRGDGGSGREGHGLSPYDVTALLRRRMPRDTIATTDVGSVKFIVSQAWKVCAPGHLLQSNGLSAMGFALPGAIAAKLAFPDRSVLCTVGDGGLAMCLSEVETAVRLGLDFLTVVYNDSQLSLIDVLQQNRNLPKHGVGYGPIDFASVAQAMGAWGRRVTSLEDLDTAIADAMGARRPALIDVPIDAAEYRFHTRPR